jgi:Leucine-rich repeat (LRR) protein
VQPEQIAALTAAATSVFDLNLQDSGIQDGDLAGLGAFSELARLRLNNNEITDTGIAFLEELPRLQYLNLYGNRGVTDVGLESLSQIPNLARLYLWETGVSADGIEKLRARRPALSVDIGAAGVVTSN